MPVRPKNYPFYTHIRWLIQRDFADVLAIDAASFATRWEKNDFATALRKHNCIGMVSEHGNEIVGMMIYLVLDGELELLRLAVKPSVRRLAVGWQMMEKLIGKLSYLSRYSIRVNVRESNLAGQLFFRSCGLKAVGVNRQAFNDTGEDAYQMVYDFAKPRLIDGAASNPISRSERDC